MGVFEFDVTASSHDLLRVGIVEAPLIGAGGRTWHRVVVAAESLDEAVLIAAQMVACTTGMPTGVYYREPLDEIDKSRSPV